MAASEQHSEHEGRVGSLYRSHRPRRFADVVGQEPVVRTLRNAVERGKVHHAYLFVGSRGTGKTSMAKILAACLNCEHGPTVEPCGRCDSCRSIAAATSLDVIEMDAASNNSVDDIRELRESVAYAPVSGRHKVYILDEAHMLSTAAWNAFLKTLEEPPPNTVFVLATTEAAKVPADGRRPLPPLRLPPADGRADRRRAAARVADAESIAIPPTALAAGRPHATGSFRDALGTLEQLVTYSGSDDRARGRARRARRRRRRACSSARSTRSPRATRARRCAALDAAAPSPGRDLGRSSRRPRGARCATLMVVQTLGEVPAGAVADPRRRRGAWPSRRERVPPDRRRAAARPARARRCEAITDGADARTQLELALVKARAPGGRRLDARPARAHRAPGGGRGTAAAAGGRARRARPPVRSAPRRLPDRGPGAGAASRRAPPPAAPGPPPRRRGRRRLRAGEPAPAAGAALAARRAVAPEAAPGAATLDCDRRSSSWPAVVEPCAARTPRARVPRRAARVRSSVAGDDLTVAFGPIAS